MRSDITSGIIVTRLTSIVTTIDSKNVTITTLSGRNLPRSNHSPERTRKPLFSIPFTETNSANSRKIGVISTEV